ncbi:oligosaccharide flippase family protein, partial [Porticoccaceae bacterium]|nr:oligosaccharide flippase family protein [Porticoccaceae bacterium]
VRKAWLKFCKHKNLALYTMPAGLVNTTASYLPEYFINLSFGATSVGQYNLATRMVNMPLTFLSVSVQDIFRQEASLELNENGNCNSSFNRFFFLMFVAALFIVVPLVLLLPYVFPIIFGSQWIEAGAMIQPMIILIAIRFVSSPLSYVWIIRGHQRLDLLWQFGLISFTILGFILPSYVDNNASLESSLWFYSGLCGGWYAFCVFLSHRFANRSGHSQVL